MWIRRPSALALSLLLLLASTVGLVGHEHAFGIERSGVECSLDHARDHDLRSSPELLATGERHEHHCVGCRNGGYRLYLVTPPTAIGPGPDVATSPTIASRPRALLLVTGGSPRGPPTA